MPTSPDDPGISPWKPRQPVEAKRLNALQERVVTDITVGPGLKITRKGNQVVVSLADVRRMGGMFMVRIEAGETGFGVYNGRRLARSVGINSQGFDASVAWSPIGEKIVIVNKYEPASGSGHSLLDSPPETDQFAIWDGTTVDDPARLIATCIGLSFSECDADIDGGTF